jgi:uncharacterized membrane protein HdeD (DUF308 family)
MSFMSYLFSCETMKGFSSSSEIDIVLHIKEIGLFIKDGGIQRNSRYAGSMPFMNDGVMFVSPYVFYQEGIMQIAQTVVRDYRWMLLFRGIIAILLGILAIVWPGKTLIVLIYLFGAYAILDGIANIVAAIRGHAFKSWGLLLVEGIVSIIAGVVAFVWPGITAFVFIYLLAGWAIVTGIVEMVAAFSPADENRSWDWWLLLAGAASVIFGILIAFQPLAGLLTVIWLLGIYAIVFGVLFIIRYFQTRSIAQTIGNVPGTQHMA